MSYFARVVNSIVENVIVADPAYIEGLPDKELYIETYLDGGVHKNYATIGGTFDTSLNAFIPPKPFPSWILNEFYCEWYASEYNIINDYTPGVNYFLSLTKQDNAISGSFKIDAATQPLINPVLDEQTRRLSFSYIDANNNNQTLILNVSKEGYVENDEYTIGGLCVELPNT
jgi:hypothetical protein